MNLSGKLVSILIVKALFVSCTIFPFYTHENKEAGVVRAKYSQNPVSEAPSGTYLASYKVKWKLDFDCRNSWEFQPGSNSVPKTACPETDPNFVGIAISGGGSRSAVLSAAVLFELERYGILQQVDVFSVVSGGALTASYYALSCNTTDDSPECPPTVEKPPRSVWNYDDVFSELEKNFVGRWVLNWFWPDNVVRYWYTHYDRSDIMAETFSDNLFDNSRLGGEGFRFHDLNPQRPYLIINATNNTRKKNEDLAFAFTREAFKDLNSSLDQYPIANAVMASAAFPAAFNYMTLKNFSENEDSYIHLFDGGTSDNLGLKAIKTVFKKTDLFSELKNNTDARVLIILIDAYTRNKGKSASDSDPMGPTDFFFDTNFMDAYDTLMAELRDIRKADFEEYLEDNTKENGKLIHLQLKDLKMSHPDVYKVVKNIPTSFNITRNEAICLKNAARILVDDAMEELAQDDTWRDLVNMPTNPGYRIKKCKPMEKND
jgi:predicted acylesterase/phospholipase RssA